MRTTLMTCLVATVVAVAGLAGSAAAAPLCSSCQAAYQADVAKCKGLHPPQWNKCQADAANRQKFCLAHCVGARPYR
jgi:hypothetical protein